MREEEQVYTTEENIEEQKEIFYTAEIYEGYGPKEEDNECSSIVKDCEDEWGKRVVSSHEFPGEPTKEKATGLVYDARSGKFTETIITCELNIDNVIKSLSRAINNICHSNEQNYYNDLLRQAERARLLLLAIDKG